MIDISEGNCSSCHRLKGNKIAISKYDARVELHAHINLKNYVFGDVQNAIKQNNLDAVAFSGLDESVFSTIRDKAELYDIYAKHDKAGIRYFDGGPRFLFNAREYSTKEGFHLLTIGYSKDDAVPNMGIRELIDESLENDALVIISHPFVDTGKSRTAGHINEEKKIELTELMESNEYDGRVALDWNGYCNPALRKLAKITLNLTPDKVKEFVGLPADKINYHDVNEKLLDWFDYDSYDPDKKVSPIVSATDLHAYKKNHLSALGTSAINVYIEGATPMEILSSMKKNVLEGRHQNTYKAASALTVADTFIRPIFHQMLSEMYRKIKV